MDDDFFTFLLMVGMSVFLSVVFGALFYDIGQTNGYCQAVHATVEDDNCVKGDTIVKRGDDL